MQYYRNCLPRDEFTTFTNLSQTCKITEEIDEILQKSNLCTRKVTNYTFLYNNKVSENNKNKTAFWKTGTREPSRTLAGPRETGKPGF